MSSHSGTWQLSAAPYWQGTGDRITIATAHEGSPMHVSQMDRECSESNEMVQFKLSRWNEMVRTAL